MGMIRQVRLNSNTRDWDRKKEGLSTREFAAKKSELGGSNFAAATIDCQIFAGRLSVCRKCVRANILRLTLDRNYELARFTKRLAAVAGERARRMSRRSVAPHSTGRKSPSKRIGSGINSEKVSARSALLLTLRYTRTVKELVAINCFCKERRLFFSAATPFSGRSLGDSNNSRWQLKHYKIVTYSPLLFSKCHFSFEMPPLFFIQNKHSFYFVTFNLVVTN